MNLAEALTPYVYGTGFLLMSLGLLVAMTSRHLMKRLLGLGVFQTSAGVFYILLAKVRGGTAAIRLESGSPAATNLAARLDPSYVAAHGVDGVVYSNPLPHVLILTAIVVGAATLAVGLSIIVRIREAYGTVDSEEISALERRAAAETTEAEA
jgi:multicomponent Na+:H+ antiporter subunit C